MVGKTRQGEVKNNIGNGEAKELICTTHGHDLKEVGGMLVGEGVQGGGVQRRKQRRDNGNSIINKI